MAKCKVIPMPERPQPPRSTYSIETPWIRAANPKYSRFHFYLEKGLDDSVITKADIKAAVDLARCGPPPDPVSLSHIHPLLLEVLEMPPEEVDIVENTHCQPDDAYFPCRTPLCH